MTQDEMVDDFKKDNMEYKWCAPYERDYFFPLTMECKESPPHKAFLNYYLRKNEIKTRETISMYVCGWMYGISS